MAESITLQTSDSNVQQSDVLGRLSFAASNESNTSDARLIGGSIYAMAEGDFTEISNPTSLVFATASSESATGKLKLTSEGNLIPLSSGLYDIGSSLFPFNQFYAQTGILDVVSFNVDNESILTKGQISWDDTEGTMDVGLTDNTSIHIGSHRYFRIRNSTGDVLYKGQAVYATGVHENGIIEPAKYVADGTVREVYFMGLMLEDVNNNNNGYAIDFGHLEEMDLDGSETNFAAGDETWNAGDILYVHPTVAGKLTKVEPKHSISIAIVLDPGNGNGNGRMFVRPTSYGHLDDNHDVAVSGVTNGQFLQYNSATDYWVPSSSGNFDQLFLNNAKVVVSDISSTSGSDIIDNVISLTQAEYDAITPVSGIVYIITDAVGATCCIDGSGTSNYLAKWSDSNTLTSGIIYDDGTNVGIGTASPSSKLDINGTTQILATTGLDTLYLNRAAGKASIKSTTSQFMIIDSDNAFLALNYYENAPIILGFGGGNVCIGTSTSPTSKLQVEGGNVTFNDNGGNYDFRVEGDTDANLLFTDASTDRVGIGTSSLLEKFNVSGGSRFVGDVRIFKNGSNSISSCLYIANAANTRAFNWQQNSDGSALDLYAYDGSTWANVVRVNTSGDVGIGTASPSRQFHTAGSGALIADGSAYELEISSSAATFGGNRFQLLGTETVFNQAGANYDFRVEGDTDANVLFIDASADRVGIGTASPSYKLDVVGTGNFSHVISSGCPAVISNTGIASGSDQILNIVSLTQAEYDAATKNNQTLYVITS